MLGSVPAAVDGVAVDERGVHELARDALPVSGGRGRGRCAGRRTRAGVLALRAPSRATVGAHGRGEGAARAQEVSGHNHISQSHFKEHNILYHYA